VTLFVYHSDIALNGRPMSTRYIAGAIPLKTDCAAFLLHFVPDKLKHFTLIFQNPLYRVFKVGARTAYDEREIKYEPIYDLDNFLEERKSSEFVADAVLESGRASLGNSETHRKIGDRFFVFGDYQTAVLQYKRALGIDPQNTGAAWALGRALLKAKEKERATEVFRAALRLDPSYDMTILDIQNVDIWVAMGLDELERKRYDKAEKIFRKAIHVKPDTEKAYFGLGEALFRQEKLEEAKVAYKKLISLNPYHCNAHENLGKIYAAQGDIQNATICVKKSLAINQSQPHLHKILNLLKAQMQTK
jgi:tetratricopeptide (TPR) repeat protein